MGRRTHLTALISAWPQPLIPPNLQERAAASTQIDWINDLTSANAEFMREMSSVYFRTVREQLK